MAITNPVQYASRDYDSIMSDINSDSELVNKPNWWKRVWAGIGDVLSIWLNSMVNLLFLRTAYTRQSVKDLLQLIDYELGAHSTSSGVCLFHVKTDLGLGIYPFTVVAANLKAQSEGNLSISSKTFGARADVIFASVTDVFAPAAVTLAADTITVTTDFLYTGHKCRFTTVTTLPAPLVVDKDYYIIYIDAVTIQLADTLEDAYAGNEIDLTTQGVGNHTLQLYSKAVTMYQQETLDAAVIIGTSDAITEWQEFNLPDSFMLEDTLTITINAVNWTKVDNFVDSGAADTHYKILTKSENQFAVQFGDGTYGAIPGAFDIYALYSFGGGLDSKISSLNRINIYAGSDDNLLAVTNPAVFTGGADEQLMSTAKRLGPLLLKARSRFVTVEDGEALSDAYAGVAFSKVNKNVWGVLSAQVLCIANGGGNLGAAAQAALQTALIDATILESIDVRVQDATITATAVTLAAKVLPGYVWATDVEPYFELAWNLFLSETGKEIKDTYDNNGIADAITLINSIFTTTFTVDDDGTEIELLVKNMTPRDMGDTIQESDAFGFIDAFTTGVDYMTIALPAFPIALDDDEITTPGVLTLTEIV